MNEILIIVKNRYFRMIYFFEWNRYDMNDDKSFHGWLMSIPKMIWRVLRRVKSFFFLRINFIHMNFFLFQERQKQIFIKFSTLTLEMKYVVGHTKRRVETVILSQIMSNAVKVVQARLSLMLLRNDHH